MSFVTPTSDPHHDHSVRRRIKEMQKEIKKKNHGLGDSGKPVIISSISLEPDRSLQRHRDKGELGLPERIAGKCPGRFQTEVRRKVELHCHGNASGISGQGQLVLRKALKMWCTCKPSLTSSMPLSCRRETTEKSDLGRHQPCGISLRGCHFLHIHPIFFHVQEQQNSPKPLRFRYFTAVIQHEIKVQKPSFFTSSNIGQLPT